MSEEIRRIGRDLVHKGAIVDVYTDHMEFSNGHHADWDFIHHDGAAAVVPVLPDGRILMVQQFRNALGRETLVACLFLQLASCTLNPRLVGLVQFSGRNLKRFSS